VLSAALLFAGCGGGGPKAPDFYAAKGVVTFEGSPLPDANVTFKPDSGPVAFGTTDANGEFTLRTGTSNGAVAGNHKVSVVVPVAGDTAMVNPTPDDLAKMSMNPQPAAAAPKSPIPERYGKPDTSGLTQTVETDTSKNVFTIELKR